MNKRINKKKRKLEFLKHFSKNEYEFYKKYPRLFVLTHINHDVNLNNVNHWHKKFINLEKSSFEILVKTIFCLVNHNVEETGLKTKYQSLTNYNFKYLMDNIEEIRWIEDFPLRAKYKLFNNLL